VNVAPARVNVAPARVSIPEPPAPLVIVERADNPAPIVNVNVPEQPAPDVNVQVDVQPQLSLPARKVKVERDGAGRIIGAKSEDK